MNIELWNSEKHKSVENTCGLSKLYLPLNWHRRLEKHSHRSQTAKCSTCRVQMYCWVFSCLRIFSHTFTPVCLLFARDGFQVLIGGHQWAERQRANSACANHTVQTQLRLQGHIFYSHHCICFADHCICGCPTSCRSFQLHHLIIKCSLLQTCDRI